MTDADQSTQVRYPRPDTPQWLETYAHRLYGGQCILCQDTRTLDVAHIHNWEEVKRVVAEVTADPGTPLTLDTDDHFWLFHQPENVVLLCAKCHRLYDGKAYTDVTIIEIREAQQRALAREDAAIAIREYFCRGWVGAIGSRQHGNIINRWLRMLDHLQQAYAAGRLPPPHRFLLTPAEMVDITTATLKGGSPDTLDQSLPIWTGRGFKYSELDRRRP